MYDELDNYYSDTTESISTQYRKKKVLQLHIVLQDRQHRQHFSCLRASFPSCFPFVNMIFALQVFSATKRKAMMQKLQQVCNCNTFFSSYTTTEFYYPKPRLVSRRGPGAAGGATRTTRRRPPPGNETFIGRAPPEPEEREDEPGTDVRTSAVAPEYERRRTSAARAFRPSHELFPENEPRPSSNLMSYQKQVGNSILCLSCKIKRKADHGDGYKNFQGIRARRPPAQCTE